jgi:hypothetical protein
MYKIVFATLQAMHNGNVVITLHGHSNHHLMCQMKFQPLESVSLSYI